MHAKKYMGPALTIGIAALIGLMVMGSTNVVHQTAPVDSPLITELRSMNVLLDKISDSNQELAIQNAALLAEVEKMNQTRIDLTETNELINKMASNLSAISRELDNTRNAISIKEHLEDIKQLLRDLNNK